MMNYVKEHNLEKTNRRIRVIKPCFEDSLALLWPWQTKKSDASGIVPIGNVDVVL